MVKFKSTLTPTPRGVGGCLVPVPRDVATRLGLKGMPKIKAVIAGQPYRGSLMPMGDGTWCLGVLKSIQETAGVGFGDAVTKEMALSLTGAKKPETRERRMAAALARLRT